MIEPISETSLDPIHSTCFNDISEKGTIGYCIYNIDQINKQLHYIL